MNDPIKVKCDIYSRRYLKEAGAIFSGGAQDAAELSPIVSYSGEGLEAYANQSINLPVLIS